MLGWSAATAMRGPAVGATGKLARPRRGGFSAVVSAARGAWITSAAGLRSDGWTINLPSANSDVAPNPLSASSAAAVDLLLMQIPMANHPW